MKLKNDGEASPLKVIEYGPVETFTDAKFNVQPNGLSAFWFELDCPVDCQDTLIVMFDDNYLKTVFDGRILTALVPDELIRAPGKVRLRILYGENKESFVDLDFNVKRSRFGWLHHVSKKKMVSPLIKPNFFIIGAPRSGTTSMYWHLSAHSNIYMSKIKEPFYFDERAYGVINDAITDADNYKKLFMYSPVNAQVVGEASSTYLSSKSAMEKIHKYNPDAKILILLRDPIIASLSLFLRMREGGVYEPSADFNGAWNDAHERSFLNDHRSLFSYGDQLENAISIFGFNAIKIVLFDDLISSLSAYEDVLEFLGLPSDDQGVIKKGNSAKWGGFQEIISADTYLSMLAYFQPQVDKLSQISGRDLSHWLKPYENH